MKSAYNKCCKCCIRRDGGWVDHASWQIRKSSNFESLCLVLFYSFQLYGRSPNEGDMRYAVALQGEALLRFEFEFMVFCKDSDRWIDKSASQQHRGRVAERWRKGR
jgi:hypothetical protein